jgi:hypothetical protein
MRDSPLRSLVSLLAAVSLGYFAGRFVYSTGMASVAWFLICSLMCPALICAFARSWLIGLGLLVNAIMAVTVTAQSYQFFRRIHGLDGWWRDLPTLAAFDAVMVALSLAVTIPLSIRRRTA